MPPQGSLTCRKLKRSVLDFICAMVMGRRARSAMAILTALAMLWENLDKTHGQPRGRSWGIFAAAGIMSSPVAGQIVFEVV